jgi:hypothetical protein
MKRNQCGVLTLVEFQETPCNTNKSYTVYLILAINYPVHIMENVWVTTTPGGIKKSLETDKNTTDFVADGVIIRYIFNAVIVTYEVVYKST